MKGDFIEVVALDYYYVYVVELCSTLTTIVLIVCKLKNIISPPKYIKVKISIDS